MAPGADIVLAVAATDDIDDIVAAEQQVRAALPGRDRLAELRRRRDGHSAWSDFRALHRVFVAATTGGWNAASRRPATSAPPTAPARRRRVSGLRSARHRRRRHAGRPYPDGLWRSPGGYGGESAWNEAEVYDLATGGAPSILFPAPVWQRGSRLRGRAPSRTSPTTPRSTAASLVVRRRPPSSRSAARAPARPSGPAIVALADELRARAHRRRSASRRDDLYRLASSRRVYAADFHDVTDGRQPPRLGHRASPPARGYDLADRARHARRRASDRRPRRSACADGSPTSTIPTWSAARRRPPAPHIARTGCAGQLSRAQYASAPRPVAAAWRCSSAR